MFLLRFLISNHIQNKENQMTTPLNLGFVGMGTQAATNYSHMLTWLGKGNYNGVNVSSIYHPEGKYEDGKFGGWGGNQDNDDLPKSINNRNLRVFRDRDEFLSQPLDAVVVQSPTEFHADMIVAARGKGKKVITEKPLASNRQQLAAILKAEQEATSGFTSPLACIRVWEPYSIIPDLIRSEQLGKIQHARFYRHTSIPTAQHFKRLGTGGVILDLGFHDMDLLYYHFGLPSLVNACSMSIPSTDEPSKHISTHSTISMAYGDCNAFIEDGSAEVSVSWCHPEGRFEGGFEIVCENGALRFRDWVLEIRKDGDEEWSKLDYEGDVLYESVIHAALDAVANNKPDDRLLLNSFAESHSVCLLYTSPSPRDQRGSRMPSSA